MEGVGVVSGRVAEQDTGEPGQVAPLVELMYVVFIARQVELMYVVFIARQVELS